MLTNGLWIPHPTTLTGTVVELIPLEHIHLDELFVLASDPALWEHIPTNGCDRKRFMESYETALKERQIGMQYPFIIVSKGQRKIVGSTRFFEIYPKDRKLEIGWTWLTKENWGSGINTEVKALQLGFCFEELRAVRVQLKTDENNIRSRRAIEKLGARFEGILRKDRLRDNGTYRNTVYYSILDEEWPTVKSMLMKRIKG